MSLKLYFIDWSIWKKTLIQKDDLYPNLDALAYSLFPYNMRNYDLIYKYNFLFE